MKNYIIAIVILVVILGGYFIYKSSSKTEVIVPEPTATTSEPVVATPATSTPIVQNKAKVVIGKSVEGRDIEAYHYGTGSEEVLIIAGIHGGYEWNTFWLAATGLLDYFDKNLDSIPSNLKVTIIPEMNPDGVVKVIGTNRGDTGPDDFTSAALAIRIAGRFNANNVDLNRNFDCSWQSTGVWQSKKVSGGDSAFSEPESQAIKEYVEQSKPKAVIVYYSAAGGVYSSACNAGILPETSALTKLYAKASGYPAYDKFDAYPTSGDMVNWLAKINVPAISVLLTNHEEIELDKNLAGIKAVLTRYGK
ncbi:MAG: hypothetical protein HZA95_02165 [Candidatus Vogelbacteria bacterium]|nr:hypothetical protein [Candidatus Vogelbacteria bacterium]